ncbi:NADH:flavin oxidoreductase [Bacteriovoracaceae bacterium]|nr:NADH:flavin oxidoreductase [Bacteriovoracaceae bacterium]
MKTLLNSCILNKTTILKNRVVVPPMASGTADDNGRATQKTFDHYKRLTTSKAGLIMVEYTYVHPFGKSEPNQLGLYTKEHTEAVRSIAKIIKDSGSLSAIQLVHGGAKSTYELTSGNLIGPSSIIIPSKVETLEKPREADLNDIELIIKSFVESANMAIAAGFDIIELHAAHGYGLNQWLSPITNKRSDDFGGTLKKRARILFNIVEQIKLNHPNILLSIRIPGEDHFDDGLSQVDMIWISKELETKGVSLINVSSGIGGWRRPRNKTGEGYLVENARIIQKEISIPVIGVGGIETSGYINKSLNNKSLSLAAVGRAILKNPGWGPQNGLI